MPQRNRSFGRLWSLCAVAACVALHTNPAFAQEGTISGRVTNAINAAPVADSVVTFYEPGNGWPVGSAVADAEGSYESSSLPPGAYFVRTVPPPWSGLLAQLYNSLCTLCPVTSGTPVLVTAENATSNINFPLARGATITGTVTNASTLVPAANVFIRFYLSGWTDMGVAVTDDQGRYSSPGLPTGSYTVRADPLPASGLVGQLHSNISCPSGNCLVSNGTPVAITEPNATTIDFALAQGGTITGVVTNAATGTPAVNVTVTAYSSTGATVGSGMTSTAGVYTLPPVPTGLYFVRAIPPTGSGLVSQLFNGIPCPVACTVTTGTPVAVAASSATAGINFALDALGTITGTVVSAATQAPVAGFTVEAYGSDGRSVSSAFTDANGVYSLNGLSTGSYYVAALPPSVSGLLRQVYNGVVCPAGRPCPLTDGTPVAVTASSTTPNINFALPVGGTITGTVTHALTSVPLAAATVTLYRSDGWLVTTTQTNPQGGYTLPALSTGSYFVFAQSVGLLDQTYNGISCSTSVGCNATSGTPVVVTAPALTPQINFALSPPATITGTVTAAATAAPVSGVTITVFSSTGSNLGSTTTNAQGVYTKTGVPPGSHFVRAIPTTASGLVGQLYDNIPCPGGNCSVTTGTPVAANATAATTVNFALTSLGTITGTVTNSITQVPISGATVSLYSSAGSFVSFVYTNAQGVYSLSALQTGSYFVVASASGLLSEMYDDIPCLPHLPCPVTTGTAVTVSAPNTTSAINFALAPGGRIAGTVINAVTKAPIANATVFAYSSAGSPASSTVTDAQGAYVMTSIIAGSYFVFASPPQNSGLLPQVYKDVACPVIGMCPVTAGTPVTVTAANETPNINFELLTGGTITGTVTHAVTGAPIANAWVLAYTSDGTQARETQTDAQGAYSLTKFTTGSYFVRAIPLDGSGLLRQLYNNINCPLGLPNGVPGGECLVTSGTPVAVTEPNATPNIDFALTPWATITGTVINAATQAPVAGATVFSYSSGGSQLRTSVTDAQGAYAITGFSTGSYFLMVAPPASSGLPRQLYDRLPCPFIGIGVCDVTRGTPVAVTTPNATNVNIVLSAAPFGQVDTPVQDAAGVQGAIAVTGWALDDVGVTRVEIYRNCFEYELAACQTVTADSIAHSVIYIGDAVFLSGARPDVAAAYPGVPNNSRAGWGYLMLTPMLPHVPNNQPYGGQGPLMLYAIATDANGNKRLLGRSSDPAAPGYSTPTSITMANDTLAKPFGAIDTPAQGETISGMFNNFGWALTPDSNTTGGDGDILIPTNGSTMTVFIDGIPTALVAYNQCRGSVGNPPSPGVYCNDDVSNVFGNPTPQAALTTRTSNPTKFRNLDAGQAAIGAFTFDTSTLSDGLHTIAWSVTDSAGRTEGIGSRFFIVANGTAPAAARAESPFAANRLPTSMPTSDVGSVLTTATPVTDGVFVRFGFDLAESWKPLRANDGGKLAVQLTGLGRLELWLGKPVEAGYMVVKGTLQPLPVGTSLMESRFSWMPPPGYVGSYELVFVRGGERIHVTVIVK